MGMKFKKSFKVAPGVRMNVGKKGLSTSIGGKGLRVNTSSRGVSVSSSVPGTGVSYNQRLTSRNKRPQRTHYEKIQLRHEKEEKLEQAKLQVEHHEAHLEMLVSVHEEVNDQIDWEAIQRSSPPYRYGDDGPLVTEAKAKLQHYKPSWRDKFFKRVEVRKQVLTQDIEEAHRKDESSYEEWQNSIKQAEAILHHDHSKWDGVIQTIQPFEDIEQLGSKVVLSFSHDEPNVTVNLNIQNKKAVPQKSLSLTKTGKLSQRNMAKGKYFQLYQDYVCSCVLRIARELFTILPIEETTIHVYDELKDEETTEYGCILSTKITRNELEHTHFENIDCSDTIETFTHNMKFLKTKGFKFVEEVQ
ncbi:DUF4236 domain-containing protein [Halobacillus yeomjeoni]|uniref:DUF4236 domain-containing protein n=1 Tax=Halobacillus yeomjeoni TaxID=311194 RepID=A0A931HT03_9BACI|nr:DUF4236 domain-containing protein [Halobacillus yeomjeoni]MBH0228828.1 DUF4236 domain-containing protein [Halobacillus yeomjeoni]